MIQLVVAMTNIDSFTEWMNVSISVLTVVGCLYLIPILSYIWIILSKTKTHLRAFVGSVVFAKLALLIWAVTGVYQNIWLDLTQPMATLHARVLFMVAVYVQIWVTIRYYRGGPYAISDEDRVSRT